MIKYILPICPILTYTCICPILTPVDLYKKHKRNIVLKNHKNRTIVS